MAIRDPIQRIDDCVDSLVSLGLAKPNELAPANKRDLMTLLDTYPSIPSAYRHFLTRAGRGAGHFLQGTTAFFPGLGEFREELTQLVAGSTRAWSLLPSDVVIADHQGYIFYFLRGEGDDPPVFAYREGEPLPTRVGLSFSDWLCATIRDEAAAWGTAARG
jgi:SMI1/KNR4 family protein SUKH-1